MFSVGSVGLIGLGLWRLWLPLSGHKPEAVSLGSTAGLGRLVLRTLPLHELDDLG